MERDSKRIDVNLETRRGVTRLEQTTVLWSRVLPEKERVMTSAPSDADFSDSDKCFRCSTMYYAHYDSTVIIAFEWPFTLTREIARAPTECPANH